MSVQAMAWVWDRSRHGGSSLLVLLAIANNCNTQGFGQPEMKKLADECRMGIRTVSRLIAERLEASGELHVQRWTQPDSAQGIGKHSYHLPGVVRDGYYKPSAPEKAIGQVGRLGGGQSAKLAGTQSANQSAIAVADSSIFRNSKTTSKATPPTPPQAGGSTSSPAQGAQTEYVELGVFGGPVWVRKPRNRRLCSKAQANAMAGSIASDWVAFFQRQGFEAGIVEEQAAS